MNAQEVAETCIVETKDRRLSDAIPDALRHERRIVYLKDHSDTRPEDIMCPSVTCPGFCACYSK